MTAHKPPPMDPNTSEATARQLELAREQGDGYGRNWALPADGEYTLRVRVEPPTFMRHDEVNGVRFTEPVEVEFTGVKVERGQD